MIAENKEQMRRRRGSKGAALVVMAIILVPLMGFVAMSVDFGGLYVNWRRMHFAADAAALNGAKIIGDGGSESDARAGAAEVAAHNGLVFAAGEIAQNIQLGQWNDSAKVFVAGVSPASAVRVAAVRPYYTVFAAIIGLSSFSPSVESIAVVTKQGTPKCVLPFGLEASNFPVELQIGLLPLNHYFDEPYQIVIGKESPGNWGKIDVPDREGVPINMSSNGNFCNAMLQDDSWLPGDTEFASCLPGLSLGEDELGEQYDGATGAAGVGPVLEKLIGKELVMLVNSSFGNGKKPVDVYGYAVGTIDSVAMKGANMKISVTITELRTNVPMELSRFTGKRTILRSAKL